MSGEALPVYRELWDSAKLDDFPVGLDYLVFECSLVAGRATSERWLRDAVLERGYITDDLVGDGAEGSAIRTVARTIIWKWRRRERALLRAGECPSAMTNRINRVERRVMSMISEWEVGIGHST